MRKAMRIPHTAREMLAALRKFFSKHQSRSRFEQRRLWNVLTALRGPDIADDNENIKTATTAVIRHAAFGPDSRVRDFGYVNPDSPEQRDRRLNIPRDHFWDHATLAFEALGFVWEAVNKDRNEERRVGKECR